jgi:glycosyltransferase involved in cell wall biosynthesis
VAAFQRTLIQNLLMRLAWFSPMPPVRTGIAAVSAELVAALGHEHVIDVYTDTAFAEAPADKDCLPRRSFSGGGAHDFIWQHRQRPYDLIIYQLGNSSHHDYIWPYLFRYPGLTVLHDAHLHHARAAALLRTKRARDYRVEFAASHPGVSPDLAELTVAGFDNYLYYSWPMTRLVIDASTLTAVHSPVLAASLRDEHPGARIESIRLAHGEPVTPARARAARARVRAAHGIAADAIVFGVFGGLTPEKRIPQILDALDAVLPYAPSAHLLLAGAPAQHFDAESAVRGRDLEAHVTIAGYLADDHELTDHMAACDVSINLRWPTAREMSGPWLRALAAGLPTITTDLAHLADVASLDPRTWAIRPGSGIRGPGSEPQSDPASRITDPAFRAPDPVTIAIDILDEDHSLRLAMRRLATDAALRASLGAGARAYWECEHSRPRMLEDYRRVIAEAAGAPAPTPHLPAHLIDDGDRTLKDLLRPFGIAASPMTG